MSREYDGTFIVFEGIDGAGTTTQMQHYAEYLRSKKRAVHVTREPSDGPIGLQLRLALSGRVDLGASNSPQTMTLMFAADRLDHLAHQIEPHLRDGLVVLSDRYDMSSIAYQTATMRLEPNELEDFQAWVRSVNRYARRPDAVLVIDVDPEEAERRRRDRRGALELFEESQLQARLAEVYASAEKLAPDDRVIHVDGNPDFDTVAEAIQAALSDVV
jgi:dTMP kinase